ncbi:hypothetical protein C8R46DRAFT_1043649 [Mycena filopes]|nr:hypothetical protein C8R46DRAFT_1043649 [Mycena filopes]
MSLVLKPYQNPAREAAIHILNSVGGAARRLLAPEAYAGSGLDHGTVRVEVERACRRPKSSEKRFRKGAQYTCAGGDRVAPKHRSRGGDTSSNRPARCWRFAAAGRLRKWRQDVDVYNNCLRRFAPLPGNQWWRRSPRAFPFRSKVGLPAGGQKVLAALRAASEAPEGYAGIELDHGALRVEVKPSLAGRRFICSRVLSALRAASEGPAKELESAYGLNGRRDVGTSSRCLAPLRGAVAWSSSGAVLRHEIEPCTRGATCLPAAKNPSRICSGGGLEWFKNDAECAPKTRLRNVDTISTVMGYELIQRERECRWVSGLGNAPFQPRPRLRHISLGEKGERVDECEEETLNQEYRLSEHYKLPRPSGTRKERKKRVGGGVYPDGLRGRLTPTGPVTCHLAPRRVRGKKIEALPDSDSTPLASQKGRRFAIWFTQVSAVEEKFGKKSLTYSNMRRRVEDTIETRRRVLSITAQCSGSWGTHGEAQQPEVCGMGGIYAQELEHNEYQNFIPTFLSPPALFQRRVSAKFNHIYFGGISEYFTRRATPLTFISDCTPPGPSSFTPNVHLDRHDSTQFGSGSHAARLFSTTTTVDVDQQFMARTQTFLAPKGILISYSHSFDFPFKYSHSLPQQPQFPPPRPQFRYPPSRLKSEITATSSTFVASFHFKLSTSSPPDLSTIQIELTRVLECNSTQDPSQGVAPSPLLTLDTNLLFRSQLFPNTFSVQIDLSWGEMWVKCWSATEPKAGAQIDRSKALNHDVSDVLLSPDNPRLSSPKFPLALGLTAMGLNRLPPGHWHPTSNLTSARHKHRDYPRLTREIMVVTLAAWAWNCFEVLLASIAYFVYTYLDALTSGYGHTQHRLGFEASGPKLWTFDLRCVKYSFHLLRVHQAQAQHYIGLDVLDLYFVVIMISWLKTEDIAGFLELHPFTLRSELTSVNPEVHVVPRLERGDPFNVELDLHPTKTIDARGRQLHVQVHRDYARLTQGASCRRDTAAFGIVQLQLSDLPTILHVYLVRSTLNAIGLNPIHMFSSTRRPDPAQVRFISKPWFELTATSNPPARNPRSLPSSASTSWRKVSSLTRTDAQAPTVLSVLVSLDSCYSLNQFQVPDNPRGSFMIQRASRPPFALTTASNNQSSSWSVYNNNDGTRTSCARWRRGTYIQRCHKLFLDAASNCSNQVSPTQSLIGTRRVEQPVLIQSMKTSTPEQNAKHKTAE